MIIRPLPSVAYSANVGGTGTLIGTPPNLILMELLETRYPGGHPLTFGGWMVFSLPDVLINLALVWIILQLYFRTPSWREVCRYRSPLNIMVEKFYPSSAEGQRGRPRTRRRGLACRSCWQTSTR